MRNACGETQQHSASAVVGEHLRVERRKQHERQGWNGAWRLRFVHETKPLQRAAKHLQRRGVPQNVMLHAQQSVLHVETLQV